MKTLDLYDFGDEDFSESDSNNSMRGSNDSMRLDSMRPEPTIKLHDCPLGHRAHVDEIIGHPDGQWLVHCWKKKTPTRHTHAIDHMFLYSSSKSQGIQEWNNLCSP